jgi:hypothetical protein
MSEHPLQSIEAQIHAIVWAMTDFRADHLYKDWTADQIFNLIGSVEENTTRLALEAAFSNNKLRKLVTDKCANLVAGFFITSGTGAKNKQHVYINQFVKPQPIS